MAEIPEYRENGTPFPESLAQSHRQQAGLSDTGAGVSSQLGKDSDLTSHFKKKLHQPRREYPDGAAYAVETAKAVNVPGSID